MNTKRINRLFSLLIVLALMLTLLSGLTLSASAATIWEEKPTGYSKASDVKYVKSGNYVANWGVRGENATFLTTYAQNYYTGSYTYEKLSANSGGTSQSNAPSSQLYKALQAMLEKKQTSKTSYSGTRDLYKYTDCMVSNYSYISSFYSGEKLNGTWDSGKTWNREHTWPNSKISGDGENDIMMLRPTSVSENSSRGNKAYGESSGYYDPNAEANGKFNLHGDSARIILYVYVRWGQTSNVWGSGGVMENLDVLLKWMQEDPVDTWEMGRNDAVQSITGARNVFVDYPELAWQLFGQQVPSGYVTPSGSALSTEHKHELEAVAAKDPSCTADGNIAYFACKTCGKLFSDAQGTKEITKESTVLPATGHSFVDGKCTVCGAEDPNYEEPTVPSFSDVPEDAWYSDAVAWAVAQQVTTGTGNGEFSPDKNCSRSEVVTFQWRAAGCEPIGSAKNEFVDVPDGAWYADAVVWAVGKEITSGTGNGKFSPEAPCTRAQIVTFLWRAAGSPKVELPNDENELPIIPAKAADSAKQTTFNDVPSDAYYRTAVLWAVQNGITTGTGTGFSPDLVCSRAQVVTFLYRYTQSK